MSQYLQGLNCVPLLENQLSPPSSSRSRLNLTGKLSQNSLVYYNGNYEGDSSMFRGMEFEHKHLLDNNTDSEAEVEQTVAAFKVPEKFMKSARDIMHESQIWRLVEFYMLRILPTEMVLKISQILEYILHSALHGRIRSGVLYTKRVFLTIFQVLATICHRINSKSDVLWKSRAFFRYAIRRLLWWMTLAKCNDLWLFALILAATPLLFLLAMIGFVISLHCALTETMQHLGDFLRRQVFHRI